MQDLHESNRRSWEAAAEAMEGCKGDYASFIAQGGSFLAPDIVAELTGLAGGTLLNLFCGDGRELLSVCRHFVKLVGVDYSLVFIERARATAAGLRSDAQFICEDVHIWLREHEGTQFAALLTTLGSQFWIDDLDRFFADTYSIASPGASFIMWDFHPILHMFDDRLSLAYDYPNARLVDFPAGVKDYVSAPQAYWLPTRLARAAQTDHNPYPVAYYLWGLGQVLTSASRAGWDLRKVEELDYVFGERYLAGLEVSHGTKYSFPQSSPRVPCTVVLRWQK